MAPNAERQALQVIRRLGVVRPADLEAHGIPRRRMYDLVRKGKVERHARGIYAASNHPHTAEHALAQVAKRVPGGVICLLTALRFHELTTQNPSEVWLAIDRKARAPAELEVPLRIVRFSGKARLKGIEEHDIDGVKVHIYNPAKTVADCFKYRRKIGTDVALEALRDCWRSKRSTMDELWRYAAVCRVTNVMRPYLEAVAAEEGRA